MNWKKRHILISTVILAAMILLLGRQIAVRMQNRIGDLDQQIQTHETRLEAAKREIDQKKDYVEKWNAVSGFLDEAVIDRQNKFTAYLNKLETERKFYFNSLSSPAGRPLEENSNFQSLRYDVSFYADLPDLVEFLVQLDQSPELLRVEKLKVSRRKDLAARLDSTLPSLMPFSSGDLSVEMTISIPAAQAKNDDSKRKLLP